MLAIDHLDAAIPAVRATPRAFGRPALLPVWQLALAWVLLIPLLYIAANGTFLPHAGAVDTAATGQAPGTDASHKISVAFVSLICMVLIAFRFDEVFALSQRMKVMLAFPVLAVASCTWSGDPRQSIVSGLILFVFTMFAIYVASRFSFQRQLELIMLVAAVTLPISILLALFVPSIGASEAGWRGIFGHKQICAAVSIVFLVTALHWKCYGIYQKLFRAMCIAMCCVLIVMSKSRTGWALALASLLLCVMIWMLQAMPVKQVVAILLLVLPAIAGAMYIIHTYAPSILASVGKDATLSQRTIIWASAWDAAVRRPILGYGFSAFWRGLYGPSQSVTLVAGWGLQQAQNGFLDVWLGLGAVGVALVAMMTAQGMRNAARSFYSAGEGAYVRWCVVIIVCTLFYNIGESSIGFINMNWFLFLLALTGLNQAAAAGQWMNSARFVSNDTRFAGGSW
jgi:exopolysaccharide production protein ExoQ